MCGITKPAISHGSQEQGSPKNEQKLWISKIKPYFAGSGGKKFRDDDPQFGKYFSSA